MSNALATSDTRPLQVANDVQIVTPMEMISLSLSKGATPETLAQLMALNERWEANEARKAFAKAISNAKAHMPPIVKTRKVDFTSGKGRTNYQYEDLATIMKLVQPVLSDNGLSVRYRTSAEPGQPITVTCIISHELGHSEENTLMAGKDDSGNKNSIQAIGSTVTYLQRYTLKAALGLAAAADDDGAKADDEPSSIPMITEVQVNVIRELIEKAEISIEKCCELWGVEALTEVPSSRFNDVVSSLRRRIDNINEKRKGQTNA